METSLTPLYSSTDVAVQLYERFSTLPQAYNVSELYDQVITVPIYAKDKQKNEEMILEMYKGTLEKSSPHLPIFMDIMSNIYSYNENIFYNIALQYLLEECHFSGKSEGEIEEDLEDKIIGITEWYTYNEEYGNLPFAVFTILQNHQLSFVTTIDDEIYADEINAHYIVDTLPERGKHYDVIVADCQNVLLSSFGIMDFFLYDNYVLYQPGKW